MTLTKIFKAIKNKEIRKKIIFILFIFVVFRLMANVPIPGIQFQKLEEFFQRFQTLGLLNLFTGGALEKMSIVMLGVGPFIIAEIALELLTTVFPKLKQLYKEAGEEGRRKFIQWAKYLTVPLAALEGLGMLRFLTSQGIIERLPPFVIFNTLLTISAATIFLVWLGEQITEKGLGNGISLLIFAGIVANFPSNLGELIFSFFQLKPLSLILFFLAIVIILFGVVLINEGRKQIPVVYTKRIRGRRIFGGAQTFLPIPVNPAGVVPIIFAISLLTFPSLVLNFLSAIAGGKFENVFVSISNFFENPFFNSLLYLILILVFTFFYTYIVFEPEKISDDLQKIGGFIPGLRPGPVTTEYLKKTLNSILPLGGIFLGIVALMPSLIQALTHIRAFRFLIGGTSLLIVVSVVLETVKAIEAEVELREYE